MTVTGNFLLKTRSNIDFIYQKKKKIISDIRYIDTESFYWLG